MSNKLIKLLTRQLCLPQTEPLRCECQQRPLVGLLLGSGTILDSSSFDPFLSLAPWSVSLQSGESFLSLSFAPKLFLCPPSFLFLSNTRPRLSLLRNTCKVQSGEDIGLDPLSLDLVKRRLFPQRRESSVHFRQQTFLEQISQNYVLLFWPTWMNWTLSSPRCDEIQDSLNGSGMFGVQVILSPPLWEGPGRIWL